MKLLIIILILFINCFSLVFAPAALSNLSKDKDTLQNVVPSKTKEEIMMNSWKERKKLLINQIYEQTNIASLINLTDAADQLSDISDKLENVNISYKTIEKQKKITDKKYQMVLKEAKDIIIELNTKNKDLKSKLLSIQILSQELKNMWDQIKNIDDTIYISEKQIANYIWVLYKINNDYYSSLDWLDEIKLLFKSTNIAQTLSREDIIKMLSLKTQELLWKLEKSKDIKNQFLEKMYSKRVDYINVVNEYKTEIEVLNSKKDFLVDLLTMIKQSKKDIDSLYDRFYKQKSILKEQQVNLTNSIIWTWQDITLFLNSPKIDLSAILKYETKTDGDKFLSWPITLYPNLSATFKDPEYFKKFGWEHDGIDIKVSQLSPIYSTAAWYVYYIVDNDTNYYNYIVIVHNYWYISLYWHVYKAFVKKWDIVQRWQLIAVSWWQKNTRWAWKLSTWPHLHFEVYKNWQLIDPLSALDLSVYKNKKDVPLEWQLKYIKDSLTRNINLDNLPELPVNLSHEQKQKLFLKIKAASWFNNLTWWVQASEKFGIDTDVAICIWYAESWLWTNVSSQNNIWNIWNNDRWDRRNYDTPQNAINGIYYALNNKYLSKYHTIDMLSRWGNKDSYIFSSSEYNWQKNVVRCLSMLKWYSVDEYFPFRTLSVSENNNFLKLSINK